MEQHFELNEIIWLFAYLSSITLLLGMLFQIWILSRNRKRNILLGILSLISTLLISFLFSILIIFYWPDSFSDYMIGPICIPALITEIIIAPLMLIIFGYKIKFTKS